MIDQAIYDVMRPMPVFKPEMRKANRDGVKNQTRRVMDPQPFPYDVGQPTRDMAWKSYIYPGDNFANRVVRHCPYGAAGVYCYMREPLVYGYGGAAYYKDDNKPVFHPVTGEIIQWRWKKDMLTSIFMPKEAARFVYRYTSIRVERVQEISDHDAKFEGVDHIPSAPASLSHRTAYAGLWDKINAKRGYPWESNPWVWVLKYEPVKIGQKLYGLHADLLILDDPMKDESFGDEARKAFESMFLQNFRGGMNRDIKTIGPWRFDPDKKGGG